MGLVAEPEKLPDCVNDAPLNHDKTGPDTSRADFTSRMTAMSSGHGIEATAEHLIEESNKARENGERYPQMTPDNVAAPITRRERSRVGQGDNRRRAQPVHHMRICAKIKVLHYKTCLLEPMPINADKPQLWKADTRASVDQFNEWFMKFAPKAYRDTRKKTIESVEQGLLQTKDLTMITQEVIEANPGILPMLRMSTCPPLARDRLIGLADSTKNFVGCLEEGALPVQISPELLEQHLAKITRILSRMLDADIFPWLARKRRPTREERYRSSTIVADRLCGAIAEPIVRNAQEKRQLALIEKYLTERGYKLKAHHAATPLTQMEPGTFCFRLNVLVKPSQAEGKTVKIPVDAVVQPKKAKLPHLPILIEAKSAGDFTNVNKRRKEEATKMNQLRATHGDEVVFVLFLCGYFDAAYLGYEAAEGIDWIWEHRFEDLSKLGL